MKNCMTCPDCDGRGITTFPYLWSDGWGMVDEKCDLCDGAGRLVAPPLALYRAAKSELRAAQAELRELKVAAALYLAAERGEMPSPPLAWAPGPSPFPEVWRDRIERLVRDLPRAAEVRS